MRLAIAASVAAAWLALGFGADTAVITIRAYPSIVKSDQRVIVSGNVDGAKPNQSVIVQGKECGVPGAFFRALWGASTDEGGAWTAEFYMRTTTVLRAVSGDELSPELTVRARAGVNLAPMPGKHGRFRVWVGGVVRLVGKRVVIERFDSGTRKWRAVQSIVLDERFGYGYKEGFRIAVPKGTTVRAVLPLAQAKPCYLAGYSRLVRT
jgi:hypothetical protein